LGRTLLGTSHWVLARDFPAYVDLQLVSLVTTGVIT
jgi:hypothetical protein